MYYLLEPVSLLLIINLFLPFIILARRILSAGGLQFDHIFLFTCGFYFYWISPIIIATIDMFGVNDLLEFKNWLNYYFEVSQDKLSIYLICTLILYIAFLTGDVISNKLHKTNIEIIFIINNKFLYIFLIIFTLLSLFHIYPLLDKLFTGYKIFPIYAATGPFTANLIALLSIALLYVVKLDHAKLSIYNFIRAIINPAFTIFFTMCILLTSLGTRSLLIASILIYASLYSCYNKTLGIISSFILFISVLLMSQFILLFRIDAKIWDVNNYSIGSIVKYLISDPLIISYSLWDYLIKYEIPYINYPFSLLSHLIGLIPSFIFPSKSDYYIDYVSLGYKLFTAQGTTSTFVSLLVNFGLIGAIVCLFCISYFMSWLRKQNTQPYITMYVMTCGWLGISFFRIFETTMIKYILQFSLLIPLIIVIMTNTLNKWSDK